MKILEYYDIQQHGFIIQANIMLDVFEATKKELDDICKVAYQYIIDEWLIEKDMPQKYEIFIFPFTPKKKKIKLI